MHDFSAESETSDPYAIDLVKFALRLGSGGKKFVDGTLEKHLAQLGDCVSIALLKILQKSQLKDGRTVRDILPIIRRSFSSPEAIARDADREPRITLFVLECVLGQTQEIELGVEIRQTIDFLANLCKGPG